MDIMVDVETLGICNYSCILSIGAIAFDKERTVEFYTNIKIDSNLEEGREVDGPTVEWWLQQSKESQNALFDPEPIHIKNAMTEFFHFVKGNLSKKSSIWANGVNFDLPILKDALQIIDAEPPWTFRQECCLRPIRKIGKEIGLDFSKYKNEGLLHNALEDCRVQVKYLKDFMKQVKKSKPV